MPGVPIGDGGNPSLSGEARCSVTWSRATLPAWRAPEDGLEGASGVDSEVQENRNGRSNRRAADDCCFRVPLVRHDIFDQVVPFFRLSGAGAEFVPTADSG